MPSVHAVVVTHNGAGDIGPCLSSLRESIIPVRVVVVDNSSSDNTVEIIRHNFPDVELMCSRDNLGFGRGNNIGIKHAYGSGAEHIFLLNQDACVAPDAIHTLAEVQRANAEHAVLSPLQLDGSGEQLDTLFAQHLASSRTLGDLLTDSLLLRQLKPLYDTDYHNAAAWMLSRRCVEDVGLFNPIFEHYGEDLEYAYRTWHKGLRVGLVTGARACHNREQVKREPEDRRRILMMEKALIRYRLCRKQPRMAMNVLSALSRCLLVRGCTASERFRLRFHLLAFALRAVVDTPHMRDQGYSTRCAFFDLTPDWSGAQPERSDGPIAQENGSADE